MPIEVMTPMVGRARSTQPGDVAREPGAHLHDHGLDPVRARRGG